MSTIKSVTTANPDNIQDTCAYISITDDIYLSLNEIDVIGDIYIKFYIKSSKANTIKLQCGNDNTTSIDVTTSWQKVEIPFTATAVFTPEFAFNVANYWIYNMKLEQASQPSQYSLAPEDYVQESENYTLDLLKNYSTTAATSSAVTAAKESVLLTAASIYATKTELNNAISLVRSDVNDKFDSYSTTQEIETIVENSKTSGEPIYSVTPVGSGYWQFATLQVTKEWGQFTPIVIEIDQGGTQIAPRSLYITFTHSSYPAIESYYYTGYGPTVYAYLISQDSNGWGTYGLYTKVSNTGSTTDSHYSFNIINFINPIPDVVKVTWTNKFISEPSSYLAPSALTWPGNAATAYHAGTATQLTTSRTFTIGNSAQKFNGTQDLTWTLSDIGSTFYSSVRPGENNKYSLGSSDYAWSTGYFSTDPVVTSDKKVKTNITDLSDKYTNMLLDLSPKTYQLINDKDNDIHVGFIAQEVEELIEKYGLQNSDFSALHKTKQTESITQEDGSIEVIDKLDDNGNPIYTYGLSYSEFIPILTALVQKQQKEINSLQELTSNLIERIELLENE